MKTDETWGIPGAGYGGQVTLVVFRVADCLLFMRSARIDNHSARPRFRSGPLAKLRSPHNFWWIFSCRSASDDSDLPSAVANEPIVEGFGIVPNGLDSSKDKVQIWSTRSKPRWRTLGHRLLLHARDAVTPPWMQVSSFNFAHLFLNGRINKLYKIYTQSNRTHRHECKSDPLRKTSPSTPRASTTTPPDAFTKGRMPLNPCPL